EGSGCHRGVIRRSRQGLLQDGAVTAPTLVTTARRQILATTRFAGTQPLRGSLWITVAARARRALAGRRAAARPALNDNFMWHSRGGCATFIHPHHPGSPSGSTTRTRRPSI